MAEVIGIIASVITIIEISGKVIDTCKYFIANVKDAPSDFCAIMMECSALKTIFENLKFLTEHNQSVSAVIHGLATVNGPIEGCLKSMDQLERLFGAGVATRVIEHKSTKQKVEAAWASLAWPYKQARAKKLLETMQRHKQMISMSLLAESIHDIKETKAKAEEIRNILTENQRHDIYKWLKSTDPSPLHRKALKDCEPGTCDWILRLPEWNDWLEKKQRFLLVHGIPGAGKTVLMSHIFEQAKKHSRGRTREFKDAHIFYYCYFGNEQDESIPFLRWVLTELCRQSEIIPDGICKMHAHDAQASEADLLDALEDLVDEFDLIYIFLDAIDESTSWANMTDILRAIGADDRFAKIQLLASTREYPKILEPLKDISVPLSMDEPSVNDDIRTHIRKVLNEGANFSRWPRDLLTAVEDAISAGAKGMFRWAVCQIDLLRRMKHDHGVVKEQLTKLPVTLYDTYSRIFAIIEEEERLFVQHVFQWILFHNSLYNGHGIPPNMLMKAVEASITQNTGGDLNRFYDIDILKDICGCLIRLAPLKLSEWSDVINHNSLAVSFAHYTVREFLESSHLLESSETFLALFKTDLRRDIMKVTLIEAYNLKEPEFEPEMALEALASNFSIYCAVSAAVLFYSKTDEINKDDSLSAIAIDFVDPRNRMIELFSSTVDTVCDMMCDLLVHDWFHENHFKYWQAESTDLNTVHLLNLFLVTYSIYTVSPLIDKFLCNYMTKSLFESRIRFDRYGMFSGRNMSQPDDYYRFDASIPEVLIQNCWGCETELFDLLYRFGSDFLNFSAILLSFICFHDHDEEGQCRDYCLVSRLLELGAKPDVPGYPISPLQIAVATWDAEGVGSMLDAGANPDGCGDPSEDLFEEDTILSNFNHLHKCSPLYICKYLMEDSKPSWYEDNKEWYEERREKLHTLLLRYGGRSFKLD